MSFAESDLPCLITVGSKWLFEHPIFPPFFSSPFQLMALYLPKIISFRVLCCRTTKSERSLRIFSLVGKLFSSASRFSGMLWCHQLHMGFAPLQLNPQNKCKAVRCNSTGGNMRIPHGRQYLDWDGAGDPSIRKYSCSSSADVTLSLQVVTMQYPTN